MEKAIALTEEQKSLIWRTKVSPQGGTADDAKLFVEICETYGLNPLLNDIVFQRYESKKGPVVNFIVSRDGYLKAAMRDVNFVKCVSAVIKEGDEFQMDIEGNVLHKFGKQRGKIIGAWSYAEHAKRGKLPVVVDFLEYFNANAASKNGRSPIWDSLPSAMIQKIAEVAALRRQFPLGGIVAAEELGFDEVEVAELNEKVVNATASVQNVNEAEKPVVKVEKQEKPKRNPRKNAKKDVPNQEIKEEVKAETSKPVEAEPSMVPAPEEIKEEAQTETVEQQPQTKDEQKIEENVPVEEENPSDSPFQAFTLLGVRSGQTPQGTDFLKLALKDETGKQFVALARGEVINELDETEDGEDYLFQIESINGYDTLIAFGGLAV